MILVTRGNPQLSLQKSPGVSQRREETKEACVGVRSFEDRGSIHKLMNRGIR